MDYNETPIRVHTQCTYQEMKTFQNFNLRRPRWITLGFFLLWIVGNIYSQITQKVWLVSNGFSVLLGTLLLLLCFVVFSGILYTKKRHKEATYMLENGFFYEFRENGFVARNNTPEFSGQKEVAYDSIYRVYDRENMLYIYPRKKEGLLIDLGRVGDDRSKELEELLHSKIKSSVYR